MEIRLDLITVLMVAFLLKSPRNIVISQVSTHRTKIQNLTYAISIKISILM